MIAIREASAADKGAVIALWETCELTRPWNDPQADFERALAFSGSTVMVAERDDETVGTVMTGFDGHRGWIYYLAVTPAHRRQGIARQLLDASTVWLGKRGCPKVELMVRDGNPDAPVYERLGWAQQPVRVLARWIEREDS
jgi:ribosomal protein S18 acetylase RimI-like enzyme